MTEVPRTPRSPTPGRGSRPLDIVLIAHNIIRGDGQGRVNYEIVRRALAAGHRVRLIGADVEPGLIRDGASWEPIAVVRRPVLARVVQFVHKADHTLKRLLTARAADVVVANGYVTRCPHDLNLCQFVHSAWMRNSAFRDYRGQIDRAYQHAFTRFNARREHIAFVNARRIVVPSQQTAKELRTIGVPPEKVSVIFNGVDLDEFSPGPSDRAALGLPPGGPLLLFAGDLRTNRKGLRFVLDAVKRLTGVHLAVVGRIAGSQFVPYAQGLGIGDRVTFLGFRRDVADIFRACDVFVFPSNYDPYGMVVSEALACGRPVITSAVTGASDLINDRCGTVLSEPSDVDALTRAITRWVAPRSISVEDDCRRAALGHGWNDMAAAYLNLMYEACVA